MNTSGADKSISESEQEKNLTSEIVVSVEDKLRADLYGFLGLLLANNPTKIVLKQIAALTGDDSELGNAIKSLARTASLTKAATIESEFHALFIGLGRGELLPYGSFYLTGFLNEKPLAALRKDMKKLGIARALNVFEPEDNIASLFEMMAGMILGKFSEPEAGETESDNPVSGKPVSGKPVSLERQIEFFNKHIGPWATHFFTDLEGAKNSVFYVSVGAAGRAFMEIEQEAFRMKFAGK